VRWLARSNMALLTVAASLCLTAAAGCRASGQAGLVGGRWATRAGRSPWLGDASVGEVAGRVSPQGAVPSATSEAPPGRGASGSICPCDRCQRRGISRVAGLARRLVARLAKDGLFGPKVVDDEFPRFHPVPTEPVFHRGLAVPDEAGPNVPPPPPPPEPSSASAPDPPMPDDIGPPFVPEGPSGSPGPSDRTKAPASDLSPGPPTAGQARSLSGGSWVFRPSYGPQPPKPGP